MSTSTACPACTPAGNGRILIEVPSVEDLGSVTDLLRRLNAVHIGHRMFVVDGMFTVARVSALIDVLDYVGSNGERLTVTRDVPPDELIPFPRDYDGDRWWNEQQRATRNR